jgi:CO/xanthine dehydrogenase FAD-binding subunit
MMPPKVVRPTTIRDTSAALASTAGARFVGGGTLVVRDYSAGDVTISALVLPDALGLDTIRIDGDRVELGAAVTMAMIAAHPGLAFLHPVAREIGGPAVRTMATVGGNLAVALLALAAEVATVAGETQDRVALEAFLPTRSAAMRRIVTAVSFALPPECAFRFAKVTRKHPHGASVLSIAALLPTKDGRVEGARVAYGAMAPTPIRARAVEDALEGRPLDATSIAAAVKVAGEGTSPASDPCASDWYRANVLPVHLARLLQR